MKTVFSVVRKTNEKYLIEGISNYQKQINTILNNEPSNQK